MAEDGKMQQLEDEVKLLKNEIKHVLTDIEEYVLNARNPFNAAIGVDVPTVGVVVQSGDSQPVTQAPGSGGNGPHVDRPSSAVSEPAGNGAGRQEAGGEPRSGRPATAPAGGDEPDEQASAGDARFVQDGAGSYATGDSTLYAAQSRYVRDPVAHAQPAEPPALGSMGLATLC